MNLFEFAHTREEDSQAEALRALDAQKRFELRRSVEQQASARLHRAMLDSVRDWQLPELPDLSQFDEVIMDFETTGLRWWDEDRMIGAGLWTPDGKVRYLPIRHKIGPNHEPGRFFEWMRRELPGKKITNIKTKFDLHISRADGVDLESLGCTFGDVAHYAALLDDHRRLFNQEDLVEAFLGSEVGKLRTSHGYDLDARRFAEYPSGLVAERACHDVTMVALLRQAMWPQMTEQGLHRVREVEERIIPVVVEMEHNGAPIDVEMLNDWCVRSERDVAQALDWIAHETGVRLETPNKRDDILRLFHSLKIDPPLDPESGKPTIADDALATVDHPVVLTLRRAMAIQSLRSKFLLPYQRSTSRDGILRYELHQLPYQEDENDQGGGAVSGRFSSAAVSYYDERGKQVREGTNVQQVFGVKSQKDPKRTFNPTQDYIVRKLFRPDRRAHPQARWFCADMRQIEYRRFVHYSNSQKLIASYMNDPLTDYHVLVHGMIQTHTGKDFERTHVKNLNFASLYGAGLLKIALMVGEITEAVYLELKDIQDHRGAKVAHADPRVAKTRSLYTTYHGMFPEVRELLQKASERAKPGHDDRCRRGCRHEHLGYVRTILGRRARFRVGDRFYSALNRVIQGTAAEDNKVTLIDVHNERHRLGFLPRYTVHDELNGDIFEPGCFEGLARFLNEARLDSRVPILWDAHAGESWAEAK